MAVNFTRRQALQELATSLLAGAPRRPNILFILTDDHAVGESGCYGERIIKTPNLDRLAAEGVRFRNCFVTNSLCAPSRATFLTGTYSHINGVRGNSEDPRRAEHLNPRVPTFPQLLQRAGYHTGIVGKWHLSDDPSGFDTWRVLPGQGVYNNPEFIENGVRKVYPGYVTDIITDMAIEFLRKAGDKPFCLCYQHKGPHRPFTPAPRHAHLFENVDIPHPATYDDDYATRRIAREAADMRFEISLAGDYEGEIPKGLSPKATKNWIFQRFVKDHHRTVVGVDEGVGRVLQYLDRSRLAENTLVIYTTDNGFFLGEHGWYDKRFMYEPSLRLPLLIRHPGIARRGVAADGIVLNLDLAPTVLDIAGVGIPSGMQGRSLRPLLEGGQPRDWRQSMYYTYYENSWAELRGAAAPRDRYLTPHRVVPHRGVRTSRYKLIHYYGEGNYWEFFDLERDPNELVNGYDDPRHAAVISDLESEMNRLRRQYQDV